jgi:hypothetical protein
MPACVVDEGVGILDINPAFSAFFGAKIDVVYRRRGGDVLHCMHSSDSPQGCGHGPACSDCPIRNAVASSLKEQRASYRIMNLQRNNAQHFEDLRIQLAASPLPGSEPQQALLILENITRIPQLESLVPMCMRCKKVRSGEQSWQTIEQYLKEFAGIDFTHSVCPPCSETLFPR